MKKLLDWIKNHTGVTILICVLLFVFPLVAVHILFKIPAWSDCLVAEWSAGELLAYIAGFEALVGTAFLGLITVYQTERANDVTERLSNENNYLQKISVQQMLPLLRVGSLVVEDANITTYKYSQQKANTVEVVDVSTPQKHEPHLKVFLPLIDSPKDGYHKTVRFTMENISGGAIAQIKVERIEFSGFNYKGSHVEKACCIGRKEAKYISWLILPGDHIDVTVDIYFNNELYKHFWEFDEFTAIGCFDMCLFVTNRSLSGIEYKEKIYIEKSVGFKEHVMYKAYEEEKDNA